MQSWIHGVKILSVKTNFHFFPNSMALYMFFCRIMYLCVCINTQAHSAIKFDNVGFSWPSFLLYHPLFPFLIPSHNQSPGHIHSISTKSSRQSFEICISAVLSPPHWSLSWKVATDFKLFFLMCFFPWICFCAGFLLGGLPGVSYIVSLRFILYFWKMGTMIIASCVCREE